MEDVSLLSKMVNANENQADSTLENYIYNLRTDIKNNELPSLNFKKFQEEEKAIKLKQSLKGEIELVL